MPEQNAYEKFTKREWAMALVGLTPGGSEFLTPQECTDYVRKKTQYPSIIIKLQSEKILLLEVLQALPLDSFGEDMAKHDAADFVDHAGEFFQAMEKAKEALKIIMPEGV